MMSYSELSGRTLALTRVECRAVWDMVQFTLNGMIFVLLGEQFPTILAGPPRAAGKAGGEPLWWLPVYGLVVWLGLILCRLLWVTVSLKLSALVARRRGAPPQEVGVRGAVALPFALDSGAPFPARDLAVLLAAMVIVFSMLLASLMLPCLMRGLHFPANSRVQRAVALDSANEGARRRATEQPDQAAL